MFYTFFGFWFRLAARRRICSNTRYIIVLFVHETPKTVRTVPSVNGMMLDRVWPSWPDLHTYHSANGLSEPHCPPETSKLSKPQICTETRMYSTPCTARFSVTVLCVSMLYYRTEHHSQTWYINKTTPHPTERFSKTDIHTTHNPKPKSTRHRTVQLFKTTRRTALYDVTKGETARHGTALYGS